MHHWQPDFIICQHIFIGQHLAGECFLTSAEYSESWLSLGKEYRGLCKSNIAVHRQLPVIQHQIVSISSLLPESTFRMSYFETGTFHATQLYCMSSKKPIYKDLLHVLQVLFMITAIQFLVKNSFCSILYALKCQRGIMQRIFAVASTLIVMNQCICLVL